MRLLGRGIPLRIALVVVCGGVLLAPAGASAAFTRPFEGQIAGPPTGLGGSVAPFTEPLGVAADAAGDVWVGDGDSLLGYELEEFGSSGAAMVTKSLGPGQVVPQSLAYGDTAKDLYVAGITPAEASTVEVFDDAGEPVASGFPTFASPGAHVAVDNSAGPSAGDVYVAVEHGAQEGIEKFSPAGVPIAFGELGKDEIAGDSYASIAVDWEGNIYAVETIPADGSPSRVDEYSPGGTLIRSLYGETAPPIEGREEDGWKVNVAGLSTDAKSKHLLVAVNSFFSDEGVVDEFEADGTYVAQVKDTGTPSAAATSCGAARGTSLGSAVQLSTDPAGELFVTDTEGSIATPPASGSCEHAVDVYGAGHFLPNLHLAEVSARTPGSAVLNGAVDPEGQPLSECAFEYVTEAAFQAGGFSSLASGGKEPCTPSPAQIVGATFTPVQADLSGLKSGTTYRARLLATSSGELGGTTESATFVFTAPGEPEVVSTSASGISSAFAELHAEIDPVGADTSYYFEYVDAGRYEPAASDPYAAGARVPVAAAEIGSGGPTGAVVASVAQQIGGLAPGTTYHFRVVAVNAYGERDGLDVQFTTVEAPVGGLPDGRVYELVTPVDKGGASDMFGTPEAFHNEDVGYASESGEQFLMTTTPAAFGSFPASELNAYVFQRTAQGWRTVPLAEPGLGVQSVTANVFEPATFARVGIEDKIGSLASATGARRTSLLGPPEGPYATLSADLPARDEQQEKEDKQRTELVGGSRDLGQTVLESQNHTLAAGASGQVAGSGALYEWDGGGECGTAGSECRLVDVNPEGEVFKCGAVLGQGHVAGSRRNAVSRDGSRIVFTAPDPYAENLGTGCWNGGPRTVERTPVAPVNAPQLYMRVGGRTLKLSAPEPGVEEAGHTPLAYPAAYVGASEDGMRVFFMTATKLTHNAPSTRTNELYECAVAIEAGKPVCKLTRVSVGAAAGEGANVLTVPAVAADGSAVYFTATGKLIPEAASLASNSEQANLYRYSEGVTRYIATVDRADYPSESTTTWGSTLEIGFGEIALATEANWYTTPDGRYLLFATAREIPTAKYPYGFDTSEAATGDCPSVAVSGDESGLSGHCAEVYRYDADTATTECVSCNPSGAAPVANAQFASQSSTKTPGGGPVRAISDDGSYVFFDTAEALVPQDGNGTLDVYEWHEGKLSLISSGEDSAPSFLLGTSASGHDVFFGTHSRLVPQDTDTDGDLYDARIGGGFAGGGEAAGSCEGSCQNPPPPPSAVTPSSQTFSGTGNPVPAAPPIAKKVTSKKAVSCKQGYVRKKVKKRETCVKRPKKKSKARKSTHGRLSK